MLLNQIITVTKISLMSLPKRIGLSSVTTFSVALVVSVLLGFLAMANGFRQTVKSSGSPDIAIAMRSGSQGEITSNITIEQVRMLANAPGLRRNANDTAIISPEIYVVVDGIKRTTNTEANLPLRGISIAGLALRKNIHITKGRIFKPGMNEIVVGRSLLSTFKGFELGQTVRFGTTDWNVVGVFESGGTVFESELWADLDVVQSLFNRQGSVQIVRLALQNGKSLEEVRSYSMNEPRLQLDIISEKEFFAEQSAATSDIIFYLGWPLGIAMAIGALAGAMNAMYSSVSSRAREIVTLRIIGFSSTAAFFGTLVESVALALLGGLIGSVLCYVFFDGITTSTLSSGFTQIVFTFSLSPLVIGQGIGLALLIGFFGGLLPGRRAAKMALTSLQDA